MFYFTIAGKLQVDKQKSLNKIGHGTCAAYIVLSLSLFIFVYALTLYSGHYAESLFQTCPLEYTVHHRLHIYPSWQILLPLA